MTRYKITYLIEPVDDYGKEMYKTFKSDSATCDGSPDGIVRCACKMANALLSEAESMARGIE